MKEIILKIEGINWKHSPDNLTVHLFSRRIFSSQEMLTYFG